MLVMKYKKDKLSGHKTAFSERYIMKKFIIFILILCCSYPVLSMPNIKNNSVKIYEDSDFNYYVDKNITIYQNNNQILYKLSLIPNNNYNNIFYNISIFQYFNNKVISIYNYSEIDPNGNEIFSNKKYMLEKYLQLKANTLIDEITKLNKTCNNDSLNKILYCEIK